MSKSIENAQVYIYESEYKMITAAAREFINDETGGDLYGTFTHGDMPIIWLASGPGPRARRNRVHFEQDTNFTTFWQRRLKELFGIQYIGSWHSHHKLGLREPSSGDREAAKTYALNHGRRKTLEIIVTYERSNETVLWAYFYPNAVKESWRRSNFVLLPKVSAVRTQLDPTEERLFSGGTNWKLGQLPASFRNQSLGNVLGGANITEQQIDIPAELNEELESLGSHLEDVTPIENTLIIRISVNQDQFLDAHIDLPSRILTRVNLIDQTSHTSQDITHMVRQSRFSFAIHPKSRVLRELLLAFPGIQRQLEAVTKQATTESQTPVSSEPPMQNLPVRSDENSRQTQLADPEPGSELHQREDVRIQVDRNQFHNYAITVKTWKSSNVALAQETFLKLNIKREQIQVRISERANNASITLVTIQDLKQVGIVLNALGGVFTNPQYSFSKEAEQDLSQLIHVPEETDKEDQSLINRFLRSLNPFSKL